MNSMKEQAGEEISAYHMKLEKWTDREMQLNRLHEEIINKREALLRTSKNLLQGSGVEDMPLNNTEAAIRNDKLLKEMDSLHERMSTCMSQVQTPRFAHLQSRYWEMVGHAFPIWENYTADTKGN